MLKFNITGDKLELKIEDDRDNLNSGSKGYYTAEFTFDSDWDGLIPHITITENGTPRADEVIVDNTHKIATTESGIMQIGVYGLDSNGKKCISCNYVCIEVKQGGYKGVAPLPKDIWDGYQITVLGYMERAEDAAVDAKASADSISNMTVSAIALSEGSAPTVERSHDGETIHLEFGIPKGDKGERGEQGPAGIKGDKGEKGDTGATGPRGERGIQGEQGIPGEIGPIGPRGPQGDKGDKGTDGLNGADGKDGKNGVDGYTPVKGVDYFTEDEVSEMVQAVLAAIPDGDEVNY